MNVEAEFDALYSQWRFNVDGTDYVFDTRRLPFQIVDAMIDGQRVPAADREQILANADKQVKKRFYG